MDVINDRNRHWGVSSWAHFTFSNFPDGRGYAEFLAGFFGPEHMTMDLLGRIAQDALYYHDGPTEPAPQTLADLLISDERTRGDTQDRAVASGAFGIDEHAGDSQSVLSGSSGNVSVFHQKAGLIVTGAGSKRQPELATFSERLMGQTVYMPISTRLADERAGGPAVAGLQHILQRPVYTSAQGRMN